MNEKEQVEHALRSAFSSASQIYVDTVNHECEVYVSVDEFIGEISQTILSDSVYFKMVDYCDTLPYKYVFNYTFKVNKTNRLRSSGS
ncbi:MAG TPA: hypothetical protein PK904_05870 [Bacteroidales bacterium]|nr:hypothetical protein [Bacteroidales bacterium]